MRPSTRTRRTLSARATRLAAPALVVGAAVLLAACGSSGSDTKASSESSTTTTTAAAVAVVKTADVGSVGTILVGADGKTLYTLTNGTTAVACTGGCLTAWPPLLLPAGETKATGPSGVLALGTTPQGTGLQVTHEALPLYTFAGDAAAGDAKGEGISSFGGTWHVVKISGDTGGEPSGSGGAGNSNTTTTTQKRSSSGY